MVKNTTADDVRTETKRFDDELNGDELIEGDRVDPAIVCLDQNRLGQMVDADAQIPKAQRDQERTYQLSTSTATHMTDKSHNAILVDPETGTLIRATRLSRQQAMTQKEADWTVREVGSKIVVDEVSEIEVAEGEDCHDEHEYAQTWAETLFHDIAQGYDDYSDERRLSGSTLTLNDYNGRKVHASISLAN